MACHVYANFAAYLRTRLQNVLLLAPFSFVLQVQRLGSCFAFGQSFEAPFSAVLIIPDAKFINSGLLSAFFLSLECSAIHCAVDCQIAAWLNSGLICLSSDQFGKRVGMLFMGVSSLHSLDVKVDCGRFTLAVVREA